ncbi:MAG TPA: ankyrin repeat domain-containing protein [Terriglobales bacterium]|jgi:ankyrin repeat protein
MTASAVIEAIHSRNTAGLRDLVAHDPSLAATRDPAGVSAIMHAIYRQNHEALQLLLQSDPPLDVLEAASLGNIARLQELVASDPALVSARSADGFTPLHFASYFRQEEAAKFLMEHGAEIAAVAGNPTRVMPLHSAVSARNLPVVRELLARGAPVNAKQQQGWTALHGAADSGNREIIDLLLQYGADPNAENDAGKTASAVAREKGHTAIVELLEAA